MRAMRAEAFRGYKELKLVELPKPAVTDGKVLVRVTAAVCHAARPYDSLRQISPLEGAASLGQRRGGRGGGTRRNELARRLTRDVLGHLRRFSGRKLQ